jgi:hypothetical protein
VADAPARCSQHRAGETGQESFRHAQHRRQEAPGVGPRRRGHRLASILLDKLANPDPDAEDPTWPPVLQQARNLLDTCQELADNLDKLRQALAKQE